MSVFTVAQSAAPIVAEADIQLEQRLRDSEAKYTKNQDCVSQKQLTSYGSPMSEQCTGLAELEKRADESSCSTPGGI